jgi:hypothetical protein
MSEPEAPSERPSTSTMIVAVLLLVAMVVFSVTGDRDDKAWKFMTEQASGWFQGASD